MMSRVKDKRQTGSENICELYNRELTFPENSGNIARFHFLTHIRALFQATAVRNVSFTSP